MPFRQVRERLAPFSPRSGRRIAVLVLLATLGTMAETVALVLVARAAIAVTAGESQVDLGRGVELGALATVAVALVALVAKLGQSLVSAWLSARLSAQTVRTGRLVLLEAYFSADYATQSRERMGELQDYLTTSVGRLNGVNQSFMLGLNALVSFAVITLAAVLINPLAAVGCAFAAAALLLLLRPLSRKTKLFSWAQSEATRELARDVTEAVRLSQEVRVFGVRPAIVRRLDHAEERASRPLQLGNFTSTIAPAVYQSVALVFLTLAVGAIALRGGEQVASLGAAVLLLLRGLTYGQQLQQALQGMANSLPFLDALHLRKSLYESRVEPLGRSGVDTIGVLDLHDVCFAYPDGQQVLHELSLRIERHEAVGVVGPSGSGKSTLLQLLLRLRPPTSGSITVDGLDLWEISAQAWSERVAFVPQEARLLDASVADNIRFFRDLSQAQLEQAAALAHIHDDIVSWPAGYDTPVGDSGNRISGGQRQRIAIARALAGEPDLLVLDEPTSALDMPSEAKLQETLESLSGRVTLVIVAHRLSTIAHCNRVLVLQDGRCEGFDHHDRLLETSAFYREAVQLSMIDGSAPGRGMSAAG
jgi:ATP-binding cassette subfamily B protein